MFGGFHELINRPDIPFPFYSLRCMQGKVWGHFTAAPALITGYGEWMLFFWAKWCVGGEWMGKRKTGTWHLAVIAALWPTSVQRRVGHINNKPTAEPLWLADDVLHSHHPCRGRRPPKWLDKFTRSSGTTPWKHKPHFNTMPSASARWKSKDGEFKYDRLRASPRVISFPFICGKCSRRCHLCS